MPVAVVREETQRFELKTLPDGYVIIRQMSYGERLSRSAMQGKMKISGDKKSEFAGELEMHLDRIAMWDFHNLVVQHNLEDESGNLLNFKNPADIRKLRADIGEEIGTYMDRVNSFEDIDQGN